MHSTNQIKKNNARHLLSQKIVEEFIRNGGKVKELDVKKTEVKDLKFNASKRYDGGDHEC